MKKIKIFMAALCIIACSIGSTNETYAFSDSCKARLGQTTYYVQSNVWQSNTGFMWTHSYKVSAKLYANSSCSTTTKASVIKTSYQFTPAGLGVSAKNVSFATCIGNGFSGNYTVKNSWISDVAGTFKISGFPLYSSFTNTAYALKSGVKATATADCFRIY